LNVKFQMPDTLLSLFPDPNDLLSREPEELGGAVLEVAPGVMQNGMFNIPGLLAPLFPPTRNGYPVGLQNEVRLAVAEALSWLVNQGLVMLDPDQPASWYRPTRRGAQLKTRADVETFRKGNIRAQPVEGPEDNTRPSAPGPDVGLGFATDTPLPLRAPRSPGGALTGATEVLPPMEPPASDRPTSVSGGAADTRVSDTQPPISIQSYLVTTPLGITDVALISLTLRFDDALHNVLASTASELLIAGFDGWELEPLATGDALLERLARGDTGLRAAIIQALDDRAAVLQFSDPTPFRLPDLKRIKEGIVAFSRLKPRTALVGVITLSACVILIQVSWGVGLGLSATAEYAVTEVGKVLVDGLTARLREPTPR
jgi:hypothetical protein